MQSEIVAAASGRRSSSRQRNFSGKIRCGQCGTWYGSKIWHAGTKYEKRTWRCNHKYGADVPCDTPHLSDTQITDAFMDAAHTLLAKPTDVDKIVDEAVLAELDTTDLHFEAEQMFARVNAAAEAVEALVARNARVTQDQSDYQHQFDELTAKHASLLSEHRNP